MKDYYKILAVPRSATAAQIKDAYRRLIKACHPDVNSSPRAAEWTRELNEAYGTLEDAQAKASYDLELKPERTRKREAGARPTTGRPTAGNQTRTESKPPEEPGFRCERCFRKDSTLRISTFWRVFSFITDSRRFSTVEILCNRCRLQESLAASVFTVIFGWWNVAGIFWSFEALEENARGGSQLKAENVAFLKALGDQLYRARRLQEAYQALAAAFKLQPEPTIAETLNRLSHQVQPAQRGPFWTQLWSLELAPAFYHVSAGALLLTMLILGFVTSHSSSSGKPARDRDSTYSRPPELPRN